MVSDNTDVSSRSLLLTSVAILLLVTIVAIITRLWVLTTIPIGFLFGFFLEKADLCGSSAFSEIILMRDLRKFQGLLVVIVISMVGFSLLDALDLVRLNPFPFFWASSLVGGVIFGIGMVLAGGCISGCLFKTAQGNMNSLAALVAIPLGAVAVEYGPLHRIHTALRQKVLNAPDGGPLTLSSVTGLSYQTLAVIFLVVTIVVALIISKRKKTPQGSTPGIDKKPLPHRILRSPWKPWQAGIAIGILASLAYLSSAASGRNYPLGATYGVLYAELLFTDHPLTYVWTNIKKEPAQVQSNQAASSQTPEPRKKVSLWIIMEVVALVIGSNVSARLRGNFRPTPKPPDEMLFAFLGGLLAGCGAVFAGGCVAGNIMSGFALMSVGNFLFGVAVVFSNWITTYFYLLGAQWTR